MRCGAVQLWRCCTYSRQSSHTRPVTLSPSSLEQHWYTLANRYKLRLRAPSDVTLERGAHIQQHLIKRVQRYSAPPLSPALAAANPWTTTRIGSHTPTKTSWGPGMTMGSPMEGCPPSTRSGSFASSFAATATGTSSLTATRYDMTVSASYEYGCGVRRNYCCDRRECMLEQAHLAGWGCSYLVGTFTLPFRRRRFRCASLPLPLMLLWLFWETRKRKNRVSDSTIFPSCCPQNVSEVIPGSVFIWRRTSGTAGN